MPRRYEKQVNHSTLGLNDAKMRLTKNMKQKYRGADADAPQSKHDAREAYEGLMGKLAGVDGVLNEIVNQMVLSAPPNQAGIDRGYTGSTRVDVYISATTKAKAEINGVISYLDHHYASLSNITEMERNSLQKAMRNITNTVSTMGKHIAIWSPSRQRAIKRVFSNFSGDFKYMNTKLAAMLQTPDPQVNVFDDSLAQQDAVGDAAVAPQDIVENRRAAQNQAAPAHPYMHRMGLREHAAHPVGFWEGAGHEDDIDFSKIKWGSFTKAFTAFKKKHPSSGLDNLEDFAEKVLKKGEDFTEKMKDKARFYQNVILKKGGRMGSMYMNRMGSNPNTWSPYTLNHTARVIGGGLPHYEDLDYKMPRRFL